MSWQDHIVVKPTICHGKACIKGTRTGRGQTYT